MKNTLVQSAFIGLVCSVLVTALIIGVVSAITATKPSKHITKYQPYVVLQTEEALSVGDTLYISYVKYHDTLIDDKTIADIDTIYVYGK